MQFTVMGRNWAVIVIILRAMLRLCKALSYDKGEVPMKIKIHTIESIINKDLRTFIWIISWANFFMVENNLTKKQMLDQFDFSSIGRCSFHVIFWNGLDGCWKGQEGEVALHFVQRQIENFSWVIFGCTF
jgi:hypothetical protein